MRASLVLGTAVLAVYALGACPTVYVGDSGELVTAVDRLGIPHPTGYPLYVLVGKLWTLVLPAGSIAWRMSLMSAVLAAATVALLHHLCRRLGAGPIGALVGALVLAASPSFWGEANVQRVYALNALFVVATTYAALAWHARGDSRLLVLAAFLCGLGASNHAFMAVYGLVLAAWAWRALRAPALLLRFAAAFLVGLLPYLYLPLRSRADPVLDWGNPETLRAFVSVVTRRHFWPRAWIERPADLLPIAADYAASLVTELGWWGAALALLGVASARRRVPLGLFALVAFANLASLAAHGSHSDLFVWHRYYIPSYVVAAILCAFGCQVLAAALPGALRAAPVLLPVMALVVRWPTYDRSRYRIAADFAQAVLDPLPPGAHLVATDDNVLFALMYLHFVERRRPDVDLILEGIGGPPPASLRFDPEGERLFFTHHPNWNVRGLAIVPMGLVFEARRAGRPAPPLPVPATLAGEGDPRVPKDDLTRNLLGHFHYMRGVTAAAHDDWPSAEREFARAVAAAPENDVLFYNLALVYLRRGRNAEALGFARRAATLNPRYLATASRPRAVDLIAEIERTAAAAGPRERPASP